MKLLGIICLAILIFVLLLYIDFKWGRKYHLANLTLPRKEYKMRQSHIEIFTDGPTLFPNLFDEIERATKHVHVLFYIVKDDHFGRLFLNLLKKKAEQGVEVRLLLDWAGSLAVPKKLIKRLEQSGVRFAYSHVPKFPFSFYRSQVRNHRKITVIDGCIGFIGGYNIGKEYLGEDKKLSPWRDYHLKITGEGVHDLQREFLLDWEEETREKLLDHQRFFPELQPGPHQHQLIPSEGFYLEETYSQLLKSAKKSISIGSPYFVPSRRILADLLDAANRGVQITIIVPEIADHLFVKEASFRHLRKMLEVGAHVYQFQDGFYHAKVLIIDERVCDSGTANFDNRSLFLNHEINCYMYDSDLITEMKSLYAEDVSHSKRLTHDDLKGLGMGMTIREWLARSISLFL